MCDIFETIAGLIILLAEKQTTLFKQPVALTIADPIAGAHL
jgi:hypothetical protein